MFQKKYYDATIIHTERYLQNLLGIQGQKKPILCNGGNTGQFYISPEQYSMSEDTGKNSEVKKGIIQIQRDILKNERIEETKHQQPVFEK